MANPTEAEMMADLQAADAAGDSALAQHIAGRIRAARDPDAARMQDVAQRVAKMPWLERQVTAFGENARHSIRQAANLLGKIGVPDTPSDADLLEESKNLGPLNRAAPVASFLGGASITAPVAAAAAPAAGAGLIPMALAGGATGAAEGMAFSDPGQRARNAALGGAVGVALPPVMAGGGQLLEAGADRVGSWASRRAGQAIGNAAGKVNAEAQAELASETGKLGGYSQDLNRKVEWVIRLLDEESSGTLSPQNRAALETFRRSPEYSDVVNKAAERVLATSPGAAARVAAQEGRVAQLAQDLPQTVADRTAEAISGPEARRQVAERVLRYGPVAVGTAVGAHVGGPLGVAIGSLAGAGTRPMVRALIRMGKNPAVQNQVFSSLESAAGTTSSVARGMSSPEAIQALLAGSQPAAEDEAAALVAALRRRARLAAGRSEDDELATR